MFIIISKYPIYYCTILLIIYFGLIYIKYLMGLIKNNLNNYILYKLNVNCIVNDFNSYYKNNSNYLL